MVLLAILCQKAWENIFKKQVKGLCALQNDDRKWESSWKGLWLWEAVDLLVMMGMGIGEWVKTKRAQEISEEGKPK